LNQSSIQNEVLAN
jgi:hypothetical protein